MTKNLLLAALSALAFAACVKGAAAPACNTGESNRCACAGGGEGLQQCLPSRESFGACVCADACTGGAACVAMPDVVGKDMDGAGAAIDAAQLQLPDPVDPLQFIAVQQINDPPVQVLAQDPAPGTPLKPGTRVKLTVTVPPDQESLGLPNSNFLVGRLKQDTEQSALDYYSALDPGVPTRATFADWKEANGFGTPADAEASAIYVTHADLGFGRHMHMRRKGRRVAFYVDNYPTLEDAIAGTRFFATVAMEFSPGPHGRDTDPFFTQFYTFNKKGERISDPILDGHGPKNTPGVCLVCHGGSTDQDYAVNGGNVGAHFIPFDVDAEEFSTRPGYRRADQEWAFKLFNEAVQATWDPADPAYPPGDPPPVIGLVDGWYGGPGHPSPTFLTGATPIGWDVSLQAHDLYHSVFARSCQTCHSQREAFRNFSTFAKFDAAKSLIAQRVFDEGAMPLSEKGSRNFWLSYPHQPTILANWLGTTLRSPGKPVARVSISFSGPLLVAGTQVTLDASQSQFAREFNWTQVAGPAVELTPAAPDRSKMTFVLPPGGTTLKFQLIASAQQQNSDPVITAVAPQTEPAAPSSVIAVAGANSATVSWTQPSDGNSSIQHSTVTSTPGGVTAQLTGSGTSVLVTGLTPATTYTFKVISTNEVGDSPASAASNAVTVFTTPGAPTAVTAARGNQQISLSWTPPVNTGGVPLTGYQITGNPAPLTPVQVPASPTNAVIPGLTNGVSYVFTVVAENGAQSPGSQSNAVTPATVPAAPASASAVPGNGSATVSWTAPASNGGDAITNYTVVSSPAGGSAAVPGSALSTTVPGLTNNTTYTFTVRAVNTVGSGAGVTSNAVLPSATPGVPSAPQAVTASFSNVSQRATITWTPPVVTGNSAITSYSITGTPAPGVPVVVSAATACPSATCSANINGLTGGLNYTFTVSATNGQGTGPGGSSNSVIIQGPPQAPSLTSLLPGFVSGTVGTLTPNWTAPSNTGGATITGYVITASPAITPVSVGAVTSRTLTSADGLARCTVYTVGIAAQNTWGTGPTSNTLAARDALAPSAPVFTSATTGAATINLAWSTPSDNGCNIDQYAFPSTPAGPGSSTVGAPNSVSISQNTCAYTPSTQACGRSWTFRVQAHNAVGFGALSGSTASLRPLVSYVQDNVVGIWTGTPSGDCTGCHQSGGSGTPLFLNGTATASFNSIAGNSPPVIASPTANSFLLLCPTANAACPFPTMTAFQRFSTSSAEFLTIQAWINDGHPF